MKYIGSLAPICVLLVLLMALGMHLQGCQPAKPTSTEPDVILAEVYDQKLTLNDVLPLLIDPTSDEDSISQVRTQVETWVREALLLHEAENNVPKDVNINKLVNDYRASLLISTYENVLVKSLLDTVVTESELKSYYNKNKLQYQLEAPILRCYYVKLRKDLKEKDTFKRLWSSTRPDDKAALALFCQSYASDYLLQDSVWYRQPELERILPQGTFTGQNLAAGKELKSSDADFEYYMRIQQRVLSQEIAPLSYVSEQAKRYILHKRKIDLLQKIKTDIYNREIDGVNVKIHI